MDEHVKRICQTVCFHIRNVNSIRKILTTESAATTIHALITSLIDNIPDIKEGYRMPGFQN